MNTPKSFAVLRAAWEPLACRFCILALHHAMLARALCAAAMLVVSLLAGCAALPDNVHRVASQARTDVGDSALARIAAASLPGLDGAMPEATDVSGVRLLPGGDQAFDARIALAQAALHTVDAQYYVVAGDTSGRQFLRELRDAARRGVRVRLLVDDLYAGGDDEMLAGLAAHANVEVRVFNPLPVRSGGLRTRVLLSLHEVGRVNRRMHNKLFIADNSFAITGGRNIADEYFGRSKPANFIDMDALLAGPAVRALSASFDAFWNGPLSYPFEAIAAGQRATPAHARERFAELVRGLARFVPPGERDVLGRGPVGAQLAQGLVELVPAKVRVVADAMVQASFASDAGGDVGEAGEPRGREGAVMAANLDLFKTARSEVLVVSPYFVPMPRMIEALAHASREGASVSVMTNSLATTDEPLVHYGYARYRSALLQMGAALYELMPAGESHPAWSDTDSGRGSLGRLHAKLAVVDRRWFYVGSMNMDRRSAHCNTELGLIVDSPALAGELAELIRRVRMPASFTVSEAPQRGGLQWSFLREGRRWVLHREPESNWAQRLRWSVLSLVVDEDFL
ncbi:phospholipase D family protein [Variovorax sp. NFACC27]|uniref:phospholipase D-like domain-containing protein n=1 Tax=unclassified Variovorax TaxID=663243 RepID=UPI000894E0FE|nr:Phosphatidylserine/phosphatidylglycerophosphate/cardiolipin synthase [Variovorax sp. NFACC28]SEG58972.1 Phosphatidylserine/phosphatidylglycerophosphate/cardiolipin synthase [Variovorax sp. NFACC29]SFC58126.1 Phosphatidylserine/phosphatidylglycerophosphate/cardiolipin synthase [Variovorax sp. NFACC26]SFG66260.1 Phosphatidylserine/phosphatidylglycerophosphate/cardiolipin synthase [Variovorax sp. NFACC27]